MINLLIYLALSFNLLLPVLHFYIYLIFLG